MEPIQNLKVCPVLLFELERRVNALVNDALKHMPLVRNPLPRLMRFQPWAHSFLFVNEILVKGGNECRWYDVNTQDQSKALSPSLSAPMSSSTHSNSIAPRLPPEIISLIIDRIASKEDWGTLSAASLLSHQYHRHARKLLFATVTLRLRCNPTPISIRDVARRIQGLYDMIQRNPEACRLVKTLIVLDSYPVYDSQWITQQKNLPRLLDLLVAVRSFTFGCEVGYHQWPLFSLELRASLQKLFRLPQLESLQLCNLGSIPPPVLITSVRYLQLNNITTTPLNPLLTGLDPPPTPLDFEDISLSYINVRTVSLVNTESAWGVILEHCMDLKFIQWRCWEGSLFPRFLTHQQ